MPGLPPPLRYRGGGLAPLTTRNAPCAVSKRGHSNALPLASHTQDSSIGSQLMELRSDAEALQRQRQQATDTLRRIDSSKHQRLMVRRDA